MVIRSRHRQFAIDGSDLTVFIPSAQARGRLTEFIFRHLFARSNINELSK
jgi:hypothetical protein